MNCRFGLYKLIIWHDQTMLVRLSLNLLLARNYSCVPITSKSSASTAVRSRRRWLGASHMVKVGYGREQCGWDRSDKLSLSLQSVSCKKLSTWFSFFVRSSIVTKYSISPPTFSPFSTVLCSSLASRFGFERSLRYTRIF